MEHKTPEKPKELSLLENLEGLCNAVTLIWNQSMAKVRSLETTGKSTKVKSAILKEHRRVLDTVIKARDLLKEVQQPQNACLLSEDETGSVRTKLAWLEECASNAARLLAIRRELLRRGIVNAHENRL